MSSSEGRRKIGEKAEERNGEEGGQKGSRQGERGRGPFTLHCAWGEEVGYCRILVSSICWFPSFQRLVFCSLSSFFLVRPIQRTTCLWTYVRHPVVRPAGGLWQWEDSGTFHSQHSQGMFVLLQVRMEHAPSGAHGS